MRSYDVKRRSHFKHSRLRRMASPSHDSLESTTLSSIKPQNGHFIRLLLTRASKVHLIRRRCLELLRICNYFYFLVFDSVFNGGCSHQRSQAGEINVAAKKIEQTK